MHLNHLDLHVPDPAATAEFFTRYLGLTIIAARASGALIILDDGGGLELVLSHAVPAFGSTDQSTSGPVSYHVGFIVDDRAMVDAVCAAMLADGMEIKAPREMRGGYLFYCHAPGKVLVEIGARALFA